MFEESFSLAQLIGISFSTMLFGISIGGIIGRSIQREQDLKMWGPRPFRERKKPR